MKQDVLPEDENSGTAGLPFDEDAIRRLVGERCDGNWTRLHTRSGLHRTTVRRWLNGAHYPREDKFLRFCGALDVDFFATLDLYAAQVPQLAQAVVQAALAGSWQGPLTSLSFLQSFLLRPGNWPGKQLLRRYGLPPGRTWHTWDFHNDPAAGPSDCYCTFTLQPSADPQVWYFAFQETGLLQWMWFRYGCVRKRWDEALLMNFVFMGELERHVLDQHANNMIVQTYVSDRPTTFRIASLHPFEASASFDPPKDAPFLCFRKPGP